MDIQWTELSSLPGGRRKSTGTPGGRREQVGVFLRERENHAGAKRPHGPSPVQLKF